MVHISAVTVVEVLLVTVVVRAPCEVTKPAVPIDCVAGPGYANGTAAAATTAHELAASGRLR